MNLIAAIWEFYDFLTRTLYYSLLPLDKNMYVQKETFDEENNSEIDNSEAIIIRQLQNEIAYLRQENAQLNEENTPLRQENAQLRQENAQLSEENARLREEHAQIRQENAQLKQEQEEDAKPEADRYTQCKLATALLVPTTPTFRQLEQMNYIERVVEQAIPLAQKYLELAPLPLPASENTAKKHNPYVKTQIPWGAQTQKTGAFSSEHFPPKMPISAKFGHTADEKPTMSTAAWLLFFTLVDIITEHLEETIRPHRQSKYDLSPEEPIYLCLKTGKKIATPIPQTAPAVSSIKEQVHGFFQFFTIRNIVHQACFTQPLPQAKPTTTLSEDTESPAKRSKR